MSTKYDFTAGKEQTFIKLFDFYDEVAMEAFNDNFKALADGIGEASVASNEATKLLNEAKPKFEQMEIDAANNNKVVEGYAKRMTDAENSLKIKTSAITIRPQNATALPKDTLQIIACDTTRWVSGSRVSTFGGGVNICDEITRVMVTGQIFFQGQAGDIVNAYIYNGNTQIARATTRIPIANVKITPVTSTIKHPTGLTKTTAKVDGKTVLTDVSLKTNDKTFVTGVKQELTAGGITVVIPPTVVSCKKGDIFYLKAMNQSSSQGKIPGGTGDNADIRTELTVIGLA